MNSLRALFSTLLCVACCARTAEAQLRPLDPIAQHLFDGPAIRIQAGVGFYRDQLASLAGVRGTLTELGEWRATIRTGRVILEFAGVVRRTFDDDVVVASPTGGATAPPADGKRSDSGDYRAATIVRLTKESSGTLALLRFGTRLPTTDNRVGLERDAIDFFASIAAQRATSSYAVALETGLAINGTRETDFEQADVLTYAATAELTFRSFAPFMMVTGHHAFFNRKIRGNEDLSEIRAGIKAGRRRWLYATYVHGLADASPENGFQIGVGTAFGR